MKKIIPLFFWLIAITTQAQDSTTKNPGQIYKAGKRWSLNDHKLSNKELKAEIYTVPAAIPIYKKAKTSETISIISSLAAIGCIFLDKPQKNSIPYKQHNGWYFGGIALTVNTVFFLIQSKKLVKKAVKAHNENLKPVY